MTNEQKIKRLRDFLCVIDDLPQDPDRDRHYRNKLFAELATLRNQTVMPQLNTLAAFYRRNNTLAALKPMRNDRF